MADMSYLFADAAGTTPLDGTAGLTLSALLGSSKDGVFYVGLTNASAKIQAQSDPGVDQIAVSIGDASPGSGVEAVDIKLALSSIGLDSAVAGDPLNLGATITGGSLVPVHWRWANGVGSGDYTDLTLNLPALVATAA